VGRRRYATTDTSRNSAMLAFLTLGEGWHNNHHYFQSSCRQGFYWWEVDVSYYVIRVLGFLHLAHDIKEPPARVKAAARVRDGQFDQGMFKAYWGKAGAALHNVRLHKTHDVDPALLEADPELATRREQLEELIAQNRAALAEHVANALAHAEELGRLTRRQERQAGTID